MESQDWVFAASTGERLEMHITYERGVGNRRAPREVRFHSAENPDFFQISSQEQVLDILRNVTTSPPDRVREFSLTAGGGSYAELFDGTRADLVEAPYPERALRDRVVIQIQHPVRVAV